MDAGFIIGSINVVNWLLSVTKVIGVLKRLSTWRGVGVRPTKKGHPPQDIPSVKFN
jgi:hypothetical protein